MRMTGGVATRLLHVDGARCWCGPGSRAATRVVVRAEGSIRGASPPRSIAGRAAGADRGAGPGGRSACASPSASTTISASSTGASARPAARAAASAPPPPAAPAPALALGGARLGRGQATDRGRPRRPIQRRIVGRWGPRLGAGAAAAPRCPLRRRDRRPGTGRTRVDGSLRCAGRLPCARWPPDCGAGTATWRATNADQRLLLVPEIGPWTVQCLGLFGRGDPDSLPAGDLIYLKLVGRLARLGRRATVEEVEEFYAPYAPFRGLAATWTNTL